MLKYLVPLLFVSVQRDLTALPQTQVPEHEIGVLQAIHGESNVYPGNHTGQNTLLDPLTEYDRLVRKYGEDKVREAYGIRANAAIRSAVIDASVGQEEVAHAGVQLEGPDTPVVRQSMPAADVQRPAADGSPSAAWSKPQLIAHAGKHGIQIDPTSSKAVILAAIEGATATA